MKILILVFFRVIYSQIIFESARSSSNCQTIENGLPCIFPFIFKEIRFEGCTQISDPENKYWCSTKVDQNGTHITGGGHFGHCPESCVKDDTTKTFFPREETFSSCSFLQDGKMKGSGSCLPIALCSRLSSEEEKENSCTLVEGSNEKGLCCPDIVLNTIPAPITVEELSVDIISSISVEDIDLRIGNSLNINEPQSSVLFDSSPTQEIENNTEVSPSDLHLRFNQPREESIIVDNTAFQLLDITSSLMESHNLTDEEASVGLRMFDSVSSNGIASICPWNNPSPICDSTSKYRSANGVCNNLKEPNFGRAITPFQRILSPKYNGNLELPRTSVNEGVELPSARDVSNQITQENNNLDNELTVLVMQMGQFIDHDLTHTPNHGINCCGKGGTFPESFDSKKCFPIPISKDDPFWQGSRTCMSFARSLSSPGLTCELEFRQQMNQITHWLDASNIYGSSEEGVNRLRQHSGGLLIISSQSGSRFGSLPSCSKAPEGVSMCNGCKTCFFTGDIRANEQLNLIVMHSIWLREHNRIARFLSKLNSSWSDEKLFQESRRIVTAEYQHIIYKEWLPSILGNTFMDSYGLWPLTKGYSRDYNDGFDPRITNEFATAAFRFGHSLIPESFKMASRTFRQTENVNLKDMFFKPQKLTSASVMDSLIRGMTTQEGSPWDSSFVPSIKDHLFESSPGNGGLDLVAINIQRGRDHGLPGYNDYREVCGLPKANSFDDLKDVISPDSIQKLSTLYRNVNDVDLFVGGFLELPHGDSILGPVFKCIIGDQFARLKLGDRFFYDLGLDTKLRFSPLQLQEIRKTSMSRIICDNTDNIDFIQPHAFKVVNDLNAERICRSSAIPFVNLAAFKENN